MTKIIERGDGDQITVISAYKLFDVFNHWTKAANHQHKYTATTFGTNMKDYSKTHVGCGFTNGRSSRGSEYRIEANKFARWLKNRDEFDEHAVDVPHLMVDV